MRFGYSFVLLRSLMRISAVKHREDYGDLMETEHHTLP